MSAVSSRLPAATLRNCWGSEAGNVVSTSACLRGEDSCAHHAPPRIGGSPMWWAFSHSCGFVNRCRNPLRAPIDTRNQYTGASSANGIRRGSLRCAQAITPNPGGVSHRHLEGGAERPAGRRSASSRSVTPPAGPAARGWDDPSTAPRTAGAPRVENRFPSAICCPRYSAPTISPGRHPRRNPPAKSRPARHPRSRNPTPGG